MGIGESAEGSGGEPQVFMMPVNRERWLADFKRTVDQPFEFGPNENRPEALKGLEPSRIWGTQRGDRNEAMWQKLSQGDIMLFYCSNWFFSAGRIDETLQSSAAGEHIWNNKASELIYTVKDYTRIAIPRLEVWDWFDYSENFTRRGLARVSPERVESLRSEVGDIWSRISTFRVDDDIDNILSRDSESEWRGDWGSTKPTPSYFILKTGGGGYEDDPDSVYHFKESIPGSRQLREAEGNAKFVYLDDGEFYATGRVGSIRSENRDGTTHYFANIEGYSEIEPVKLATVRDDIQPNFPVQYGIIKIPESDFKEITHDGRASTLPETDHPLLNHLSRVGEQRPVRKFTAPPDYWLTAFRYGSIALRERERESWEKFEEGDLVIFHSRADPSNPDLPKQPNGLVGAGIVGGRCTKESDWWWDEFVDDASEYEDDAEFSLVVSFDRLFVTGDTASLDLSRSVVEKSREELTAEISALTEGLLELDRANDLCVSENGRGFPVQQTVGTFRAANGGFDIDRPRALLQALAPSLSEISSIAAHESFDGEITKDVLDGLYFPGDQAEEIIDQVSAALRSGKHIVFTGPPGTGKTEIARLVCTELARSYPYLYSGYQLTTATADWSTFDTVGGYMPNESDENQNLSFNPGIVLNRMKSTGTGVQVNEPVIIDELNRADIDKAFGQLFTLLSGQSVQLPYTIEGNEVELLPADQLGGVPAVNQFVVPDSWRIFATMNTYDKTSLYEMSYAFMRRFAFVRIGAPELPEDEQALEDLVRRYANEWDGIVTDRRTLGQVGQVWKATNRAVDDRSIGPAIIRDILGYISQHRSDDLEVPITEAVISYVFPQLEGVPKRELIVRRIADVASVDQDRLSEAARDMLQIDILEADE